MRDAAAWEGLTLDDQTDLVHQVAGLPSGLVDDDLEAKQFDLLVLRTQLALLRSDHGFDDLAEEDCAARQSSRGAAERANGGG